MIAYSISGMFYEGITWEDFFTDNDGYPNFTIETHNKESLEEYLDLYKRGFLNGKI